MKNILLACLVLAGLYTNAQSLKNRTVTLMGSRWGITLVAKDSLAAENYIDTVVAEVTRIENLISDWRVGTQIFEVNTNAGIRPVKVDPEVFSLTQRAIKLSEFSNGAFDISFAAMDKIWKFDGSMTAMPSPERIIQSVKKVGYKNIILDSTNSTIFLKHHGMKIGFGALGEGYAADRSREMMIKKGIKAGIVNGSGDMSIWGKHPNGKAWTIGIANPISEGEIIGKVKLTEGAVVTSGSYEKFVIFNGKRYSHIINPKTGYPASGLCSVTIFGPSAEIANSLSTTIMVLGKDAAENFIKRFPEYKFIIITDEGNIFSSPKLNFKKRRI